MKTKILMVCLGNICRSPLAEGILKSKIDTNEVYVDSAGTGGYHIGNPPDPRSILVAKKYGIDIAHQRCRKFEIRDFQEFDIIYVMDNKNYSDIMALAQNESERKKVKLILESADTSEKQVPDPYYDKNDGFEHVFELLNKACTTIAKNL